MGVSFRKRGKLWEYRFDGASIGNKRQQISKGGFRTKKEAETAGNKAYTEYCNIGKTYTITNMSYADLLDEWFNNYCKINLIETSIKNYEKAIRLHIKPFLGKYRLSSLETVDLQNFINFMFSEGYSRNRLANFKGIVTGSMKYAKKMNYIKYNPALEVELPSVRAKSKKKSNEKKKELVTPEIFNKIITRFPEGTSAHIPLILGYRTGMRLGEVFALTWDDIDFKEKTIDINKQVQDTPKAWTLQSPKYNSNRKIPIDDDTINLLKRERLHQKENRLLYGEFYTRLFVDDHNLINPDHRGKEVNFVMVRENGTYIQPRIMQHCSRVIHGKCKEPIISEKFDFHSLRTTHTTNLLDAGADIKDVQKRLGHKNIETTLNDYAKATKTMEDRTRDIIERMFVG